MHSLFILYTNANCITCRFLSVIIYIHIHEQRASLLLFGFYWISSALFSEIELLANIEKNKYSECANKETLIDL